MILNLVEVIRVLFDKVGVVGSDLVKVVVYLYDKCSLGTIVK